MGSILSSPLSSIISPILFPARRSSYNWDFQNIISIPKKGESSESVIPALYFGNDDNETYVIYSHGNGEDIGECYSWLKFLYDNLKVNIIAYDYQGYGLHEGNPSENACYRDIKNVFDHLVNCGVDEKNIILYGRSLGTGPTVELASKIYGLKGVILESPYTSIFSVVSASLAHTSCCVDPFRNKSKINMIKCPLLIIHGTNDEVIPYEHGQALQKKSMCNLVTLEGGGHNDLQLYYKDLMLTSIRSFINCEKNIKI